MESNLEGQRYRPFDQIRPLEKAYLLTRLGCMCIADISMHRIDNIVKSQQERAERHEYFVQGVEIFLARHNIDPDIAEELF
jgi:hypothetical protein